MANKSRILFISILAVAVVGLFVFNTIGGDKVVQTVKTPSTITETVTILVDDTQEVFETEPAEEQDPTVTSDDTVIDQILDEIADDFQLNTFGTITMDIYRIFSDDSGNEEVEQFSTDFLQQVILGFVTEKDKDEPVEEKFLSCSNA